MFQPNNETNLEANVREVADFTRGDSGKGMYSLKEELRDRFNPCFYHYDKGDQSKAEEYQRSHRRNANLDQGMSCAGLWHYIYYQHNVINSIKSKCEN